MLCMAKVEACVLVKSVHDSPFPFIGGALIMSTKRYSMKYHLSLHRRVFRKTND